MKDEICGLLNDISFCDRIVDYFESRKHENNVIKQGTNFYAQTIHPHDILDDNLRKEIKCLLYRISQEFYVRNRISIYPEFWSLAYWAPNTFMEEHVDARLDNTGSLLISNNIKHYTCICYLNDDYDGGETFLSEFDYACKPEKGKIFIFESNLLHGVRKIKNKGRYTLNTWFTKNSNFLME